MYFLNSEKFFVHFQDKNETVVILNYDEQSNTYFRLTHFGAAVVHFVNSHPNCTHEELLAHLQENYEGSDDKIASELEKVLTHLHENELL